MALAAFLATFFALALAAFAAFLAAFRSSALAAFFLSAVLPFCFLESFSGFGAFISSEVVESPHWASQWDSYILFYDLDEAFVGIASNLYLSIDDDGDFEIDSAQITANPIPLPPAGMLIVSGLLGLRYVAQRRNARGIRADGSVTELSG